VNYIPNKKINTTSWNMSTHLLNSGRTLAKDAGQFDWALFFDIIGFVVGVVGVVMSI
jgi:hypothetical protein